MDIDTVRTYDMQACNYAAEWEEDQAPPDDLRAAVRAYFNDGLTVDVGCGSGRDTAWLAGQGFEVMGVDAAPGLLAEARRRHPEVTFDVDALPSLPGLGDRIFTNVLCETVIMHLVQPDAIAAVRRLCSLLAPGGTLYLSWRVGDGADRRDDVGRLYAAFATGAVRATLADLEVLLDEDRVSASSKKVIHRIVARRASTKV
ncbi:MAG: class I SAM-dependent methyltransferase [Rhodospirillales bacterium]|nr:class I SAM-dependent methyltransferase [Rhodospirillales bacterium]